MKWITSVFIVLAPQAPALAADWYVDAGAACPIGDGSAARPFCTIAEALAVAASGDQVLVAPGSYAERLVLTDDLTIRGMAGAALTRIDAGLSGSVVEAVSADIRLEGLTLTNGQASVGGGLRATGSRVTLIDCHVSDNQAVATFGGRGARVGGLAIAGGELILERCHVTRNRAVGGPNSVSAHGALFVDGANRVRIEATWFQDNGADVLGLGGIENVADLVISGSTFSGSRENFCDGSFRVVAVGTASVTNCTFVAPTLFESENLMFALRGNESIVVDHCTFLTDCTNPIVVGAVPGTTGSVTVSNSLFAREVPTASPGGAAPFLATGGFNVFATPLPPGSVFTHGVNGDVGGVGLAALALGPLQDNGGATPTVALGPQSVARNNADPNGALSTDQRGVLRAGPVRDRGAFERSEGVAPTLCVTASNSTGVPGRLAVTGDLSAAGSPVALTAYDLPSGSTCIFLCARALQWTPTPGGSQGNLCLGGAIGRFQRPGEIGTTSNAGVYGLAFGVATLPQPNGSTAGVAGETWHFQAWHRDVALGAATSNFTEARSVTLQ